MESTKRMAPDIDRYRQELQTQGFAHIKAFYGAPELQPLKARIVHIVALLYRQSLGKSLPSEDFDSAVFQSAYLAMVSHDRKQGSIVYDAVKQIPEFMRITASAKNVDFAAALRQTDAIGINRGGDGIRIDYPSEERFMAPWHQDYPSQFGSIDGLVFWAPLVDITEEMGPLEICIGSHKGGLLPVYYDDEKQSGKAYGMRIADEAAQIAKYPHRQLTCAAGDLLVIDFLTLHRSGFNQSSQARWSMQLRYFNFNEPQATAQGWPGGLSQGNRPEKIHPGILVTEGQ